MKFLYSMDDVKQSVVEGDVREHAIIELESICGSVSSIGNLNNFNLSEFGSILILESIQELEDIIKTNSINGYGVITRVAVERRILQQGEVYIIKFICSDKLIECIIHDNLLKQASLEAQEFINNYITKTLSIRKKVNMNKYIIYAYSYSTVLVGESSFEIDGAYVVIFECMEARNEEEALRKAAMERDIDIEDLIAVELK